MNSKRHALLTAVLTGICFFFFFGATAIVSSGEQNPAAADTRAPEQAKGEALPELPVFISIPELELERPPVQFYHDKHTKALNEEGCGICHPENKDKEIKGQFLYRYPKIRAGKDKEALMNSYHNACIGCHNQRTEQGKKAGPVTCGECHLKKEDYEKIEYAAVKPEYYEPAGDIYHQDCLACHKEGTELKETAGPLDWGEFYVQVKTKELAHWPPIGFDYYLHHKHEKALEKKCERCHHIYSEEEKKLIYKEGTESSCRDCHKEHDVDKKRSFRHVAHSECITCHMERAKEGKKGGPSACGGCHNEKEQRTVEEMADIPRQDLKQKETYRISVDDATLKEVPFNHKAHEGYTRSCRDCHHETMKACKTCHTLKGDTEQGGNVTLAEAYHEVRSGWSCIGCHEVKKSEPSCGGCHRLIKGGLSETAACLACHSGPQEETEAVRLLPAPDELLPDKVEEELKLGILEKDYKPSTFPHVRIIKKLTDISNESKLAKYFHSQPTSMCRGCHHYSPLESKKPVSPCSTCHSIRMEPRRATPTLFGAYHRQCLGCHDTMELKLEVRDCTKCHEEKPKAGVVAGK